MDGDNSHLVVDSEGTLAAAGGGSASAVVGAASASDALAPAPAAVRPQRGQGRRSHRSQHAEDVKECNMYSTGFCPNGPRCKDRHVKKAGPPPPVEEVVKKLLQMDSLYHGSSSGIYQPRDNNNNLKEKHQVQHGSVLKNQNLSANATPAVQQPATHHVQTENPLHVPPHLHQQQQNSQLQGVPNGSSDQATTTASPRPQGQSRWVGGF